MMRPAVGAFALALLLGATAQAQGVGPGGRGSYFNVHGEVFSKFSDGPALVPSGIAIDWGGFQSRYVGAGTRIGLSRAGGEKPVALFIGGGPQGHIPLGDHFVLIPALNLGLHLANSGIGYAAYGLLAGAFVSDRYYFGLEVETPIYLQGRAPSALFPGAVAVDGLFGLYY